MQDRLRHVRDKVNFFKRTGRIAAWGMGEIFDVACYSQLANRFVSIGIEMESLASLPAFAKLMAYWWIAYREVEETGARVYGDRFVSIPFARFCEKPQAVVEEILSRADVPAGKICYAEVHAESPPYQPENDNWRNWRERLGIPEDLGWAS
jgi:hypothetical protein